MERLDIHQITTADGAFGLRKLLETRNIAGVSKSLPATCFPSSGTVGNSWDRPLLFKLGKNLGEECRNQNIQILLGPGANIKRSPLNSRNYDYFSEDPFLTGELAACYINGLQSVGVGASLKHFAVNNQEKRRMTIDAIIDERALREVYLAGFEIAVKKSQPWSIMCAYNKINGEYASENKHLLKDILREEWELDGTILTDLGASSDRIKGLEAGTNLEMPGTNGRDKELIMEAIATGKMKEEVLDKNLESLLKIIYYAQDSRYSKVDFSYANHNDVACEMAMNSAVLLKNNDNILPFNTDMKVLIVGELAEKPRIQAACYTPVNPVMTFNVIDEFKKISNNVTFEKGYKINGDKGEMLIENAIEAASKADVVIVIAGLPTTYEVVEAPERTSLELPSNQNELIRRLSRENKNIVVALMHGTAIEMPWLNNVKGVIDLFLGGQAVSTALAKIVFGLHNPSGKLAETYPLSIQDTPCYKYFPEGPITVEYRESIYVGYRYYDKAKKNVLFPFGHGLSYASFEYTDVELTKGRIKDNESIEISFTIKNVGSHPGAEVIQLYVRDIESTIFRPENELKDFEKVYLELGEEKRITFRLDFRSFAYFNINKNGWHVESGQFQLNIGSSSRDIRLHSSIFVETTEPDVVIPDYKKTAPEYYELKKEKDDSIFKISDNSFKSLYGNKLPEKQRIKNEPFTVNSTFGDLREFFVGRVIYDMVFSLTQTNSGSKADYRYSEINGLVDNLPIRSLSILTAGVKSANVESEIVNAVNKRSLFQTLKIIIRLMRKK